MCITGCAPKAGMLQIIKEQKKGQLNIEAYKHDKRFLIKEQDLSFDPIAGKLQDCFSLKKCSTDNRKCQAIVKEYTREKLKSLRFRNREFLYQGCMLICNGEVKNTEQIETLVFNGISLGIGHGISELRDESDFPLSLRPCRFIKIKKGNDHYPKDIKIIFVFSHNSSIKGFMFMETRWVHIISSRLKQRFLDHHSLSGFENKIDGVNVFFIKEHSEINNRLNNRLINIRKQNQECCIICKNDEIESHLTEFVSNKDFESRRMFFIRTDTEL